MSVRNRARCVLPHRTHSLVLRQCRALFCNGLFEVLNVAAFGFGVPLAIAKLFFVVVLGRVVPRVGGEWFALWASVAARVTLGEQCVDVFGSTGQFVRLDAAVGTIAAHVNE